MSRTHPRAAGLAAAVLSLATVATLALAVPAAGAATIRGCTAADLAVTKGRLEPAAGSRYQTIQIRNVSSTRCRLYGTPTYHFRKAAGPIGWDSRPTPDTPRVVVLTPNDLARSTLIWADPGVTVPRECRARRASGFSMVLAYRPHAYQLTLDARVCTTRKYRPWATPVVD